MRVSYPPVAHGRQAVDDVNVAAVDLVAVGSCTLERHGSQAGTLSVLCRLGTRCHGPVTMSSVGSAWAMVATVLCQWLDTQHIVLVHKHTP